MKGALFRNLSLFTRHLRLSPFNATPPSSSFSLSLAASTALCTRFFSSSSRNTVSDQPNFSHTHNKNDPIDVEDISNEELKRRVARLREGDDEAIPSLFEAILQRSLAGKPIEDDPELMRDILGKGTDSEVEDEDEDDDYSDWEESSDIDDDGK
ncbi:hypothetical protein HN51_070788 [Arachis hypogaea]|uniref:Uncharacterized protein n=1 Tax=Arachis hypogaea TaxID=3818 RepID=A0A444Z0P8_ARAHY|nr:uncharacterized protein LOC107642101 [Arachis ipaensis]XP_025655850.1 uncharacterized protein LOC112751069 [Arachis hypogaea]QHO13358.1 uncharacterized protein DS421_15g514830 [Arachis hypogaea]RYR07745.1 hypothetical protein Ahy_B05g075161 isoform C [Arachis hypogaea]